MSALTDQITKVLREHDLKAEVWSWFECECGIELENYDGWQAHVASVLEAELQLTEEWLNGRLYDGSLKRRWVSAWSPVPEEKP